jgi:membrane-anchored protein YejM (alkaline phosphatase superfamily)
MRPMTIDDNFLLLTYDSCRYDVLVEASTPVLDSWADVLPAEAPANFTFASHQAFFVGILPNTTVPVPYYNRFCKQLIGLVEVGETHVAKDSRCTVASGWNIVRGLADAGYQTVGAGAMNWFRQESLTTGFERFLFTGTDATRQVDFLVSEIDPTRPFFAFVNFGETHAPFVYEGKQDSCPVDVRARVMEWPPVQRGPVGRASEAFAHQMRAAEYLDRQLPRLLSALPANTVVILCADHGEAFGEDGYWGHGVNHATVLEVPLAFFRLDGRPV